MESSRKGVQWLMLGPISFMTASCKPNIASVNVKNIMMCVPLREIKDGEELTESYQNHFLVPTISIVYVRIKAAMEIRFLR